MIAILDNVSELTTGGIFVVLVLKLVFDFLNAREAKKRGGEMTQFIKNPNPLNGEAKKIAHDVSEIHDVLLAQPPRQSVVATLGQVDETMRDQVQRQREAVHVLTEIRDELKTHGPKLDDAKCGGCSLTAGQKKI